mmetsp:Transcript_7120/g.20976  ORF Transcript_7120/g.20976 Transcript_7120/m.20976 type:complete len:305 (-) Transcript_7120:188-1102(-)
MVTSAISSRAKTMRLRRASEASRSSSSAALRASPPAANLRTESTASTRWSTFRGAASAERETAMRSSRWSRISPSSGLKVAMSSGLHTYVTEMPSRSTMTLPSEMTCSRMFVASASSKLMSSTYKTPRWALARRPGWKTLLPSVTDFSTSMEPRSMSSMTLSGICTKGARTTSRSKSWRRSTTPGPPSAASASSLARSKESISSGISGSTLYCEPLTTSMGGRSECSARAMTDLAVPRPPEMSTPPMSRLTAARSSAVLMLSWPTTIDSGRPFWASSPVSASLGAAASAASMAAMRSSGVSVAV